MGLQPVALPADFDVQRKVFPMHRRRYVPAGPFLGLVFAILIPGVLAGPCFAIPPFWKAFEQKYVTDNDNAAAAEAFAKAKCNVCHVEGQKKSERNPFGVQLSELLDKDNFKKDRLDAEPDKANQEIFAALDKVAAMKTDPEKDDAPTFGDRIAQGLLPGAPPEEKVAEKEEKPDTDQTAELQNEEQPGAEGAEPAAADAPTSERLAALLSQLVAEEQSEQLAAIQAEWMARLKRDLRAELRAQLRDELKAALVPQIKTQLRYEQRQYNPDAEKSAIARIEEIGGSVRPIAMNDDSQEVDFHLGGTSLDDEGLALIKDLREVVHLHLKDTAITDAGLAHLADMAPLRRLHLEKTGITDAGLVHLRGLGNLEYLNLYGTAVTDAGLEHLKSLDGLRKLYLWQTKVTDQGVADLQQALPQVTIVR